MTPATADGSESRNSCRIATIDPLRRRHGTSVLLIVIAAARPSFGASELEPSETEPKPRVYFELPTFDVNSNGRASYPVPSPQQSLWISVNSYELVNHSLASWTGLYRRQGTRAILAGSSIFLANLVLSLVPTGMAWQHEAWHKAVLSMHGIDSRADSNKVTGVSDESLAAFKRDSRVDFVRLHTAGIEGGYEAANTIEKNQFFRRLTGWNVPTLWTLYGLNSFYMQICASSMADSDASDAAKQTDILSRDVVGSDCTGWTYELFRPRQQYSARGVHPTGTGVRRYRTFSELSPKERDYLRLQRSLSLLNFLDPALIGLTEFRTGSVRYSGHVRHMPTSFGHMLALDGFVSLDKVDLFFSAAQFFNRSHWFPGVVAELWRYPVPSGIGPDFRISVQLQGWLQPQNQLFATAAPQPGGMSTVRLSLPGPQRLEPYVELQAKSEGWAAGVLTQSRLVAFRTGIGFAAF